MIAMSPFIDSVNRLAAGSSPLEALHDELTLVVDALEYSSAKDRDEALRILSETIAEADLPRASLVALGCGAIVEHGGEPNLAIDAILARLPKALARAKAYRDLCKAAEAKSAEQHGGEPPKFFFHGPQEKANESNDLSLVWDSLDSLARGANAMLARSVEARKRAKAIREIRDLAWELADDHEQAGYLAELLEVLDDEVLLVLRCRPA